MYKNSLALFLLIPSVLLILALLIFVFTILV